MLEHAVSVVAALCFAGPVLCSMVGVRVTELRVPAEALLGESVRLVCRYELAGEELYVVKWYKDELEFYRYEPKDRNQTIYFPQPGIDIDLTQSGRDAVFLRRVALASAGVYKCQVSTEAPTYSCVQAVKEMDVVIMPMEDPFITGGDDGYSPGDNITLNCTTPETRPIVQLRWLVNGKPVPETATTDHGVRVDSVTNLRTTSRSIQLVVNDDNFWADGTLSVRCESLFRGRVVAATEREFSRSDKNDSSSCISATSSTSLLLLLSWLVWLALR